MVVGANAAVSGKNALAARRMHASDDGDGVACTQATTAMLGASGLSDPTRGIQRLRRVDGVRAQLCNNAARVDAAVRAPILAFCAWLAAC